MKLNLIQKRQDIKRIVLLGPESTGKTTLAKDLAKHFSTTWVEEYLRDFALEKLKSQDKDIKISDNLHIVTEQLKLENQAVKDAKELLICDTNFVETMFYSYLYFGKINDFFSLCLKNLSYDLYLLTNIDLAWQADEVRDKPNDRQKHYDYFKALLQNLALPFVEISGVKEERVKKAIYEIEKFLKEKK